MLPHLVPHVHPNTDYLKSDEFRDIRTVLLKGPIAKYIGMNKIKLDLEYTLGKNCPKAKYRLFNNVVNIVNIFPQWF